MLIDLFASLSIALSYVHHALHTFSYKKISLILQCWPIWSWWICIQCGRGTKVANDWEVEWIDELPTMWSWRRALTWHWTESGWLHIFYCLIVLTFFFVVSLVITTIYIYIFTRHYFMMETNTLKFASYSVGHIQNLFVIFLPY